MPSSRAADVILPPMAPQRVLDQLPFHAARAPPSASAAAGRRGIRQLQVAGGDALALGHDGRPLHPVLQLADVPRPGVEIQCAQRIGRERQARLAVLRAIAAQELPRDQPHIVAPLAQGGSVTTSTASRK